jgi:mRNA interferase RelE/StbE
MSYTVVFLEKAQEELTRLPQKAISKIIEKIDRLAENPNNIKSKKLIGSPFYRIRVGDYRVIYEMENEILLITIISVGHRKNIYRNL